MELILGDCTNVNPPLIINQNSTFPGDSDSTSTPLESQMDNVSISIPADNDGDPHLTRVTHRAKKRHKTYSLNEGVNTMLEVFETWLFENLLTNSSSTSMSIQSESQSTC